MFIQSVKSNSYAILNPASHSPLHSTSKSLQKYTFFLIHNTVVIFFLKKNDIIALTL